MSDPVTALLIGGTIIGGGTAAAGSIASGNAAFKQAQYQAAINEQNATYANYQGAEAIAQGKVAEAQQRRAVASAIGTQRATLAGLGQIVDTGSAGIEVADTAQLGEADALTIRRNAQREKLSFDIQANQARQGAVMNRMAGDSARTAGFLNAAGTLLTTAGAAGGQYYGIKANQMTIKKGG